MNNEAIRHMRAACSLEGASARIGFDVAEVRDSFQREFECRMKKKGIELTWVGTSEAPEINVRILKVDEGNQLLRYLIPLAAPASVEIEASHIGTEGQSSSKILVKKAHTGLLGGNPKSMISSCVAGLAKRVARDIA